MKNKKITPFISNLKRLISAFGGRKSLRNPLVISVIIDELSWIHPNMDDFQLEGCRKYLNKLKTK